MQDNDLGRREPGQVTTGMTTRRLPFLCHCRRNHERTVDLIHLFFYGANIVIRLERMSGAQVNEAWLTKVVNPAIRTQLSKKVKKRICCRPGISWNKYWLAWDVERFEFDKQAEPWNRRGRWGSNRVLVVRDCRRIVSTIWTRVAAGGGEYRVYPQRFP